MIWVVNKTVRYNEEHHMQVRALGKMLVVMTKAHTIQQFIHRGKLPIFTVKHPEINC